jgi:DNA-binding CsgD family transcriptional regulator
MMLDFNAVVDDVIIPNHKKIQHICQPLYDHLGINYFSYHSIDANGDYRVLVDSPSWAEHFVGNEFYRFAPLLSHPEHYQAGSVDIISADTHNMPLNLQEASECFFHTDYMIVLITGNEKRKEFFGFASPGKKGVSCSQQLNDIHLLKRFIRYFKTEASRILKDIEQSPISLIDVKGDAFFANPNPFSQNLNFHKQEQFFSAIGSKLDFSKLAKLSPQEKRCLYHVLEGLSAQESAESLTLSKRTVEYYLENSKNKLNCYSKRELFAYAREMEQLGLFD